MRCRESFEMYVRVVRNFSSSRETENGDIVGENVTTTEHGLEAGTYAARATPSTLNPKTEFHRPSIPLGATRLDPRWFRLRV